MPYYLYEELPTATKVRGTEKIQVSAFLCGEKLFLEKFLLLISKAFINPLFLSEHKAGKRHYIIMKVGKKYLGQNPRQTPPFLPPTKSHSLLPLPKRNKDGVIQLQCSSLLAFMLSVLLHLLLPLPSYLICSTPSLQFFSFAFLSLTFLFSPLLLLAPVSVARASQSPVI